ncbi:MAG: tetratricopeptide repeat protein [Gemmatimonadetes bacterium]|nr:tetratricopeptide repeat protein [Gemmatimonadota bacterium]MYK00922.1 tetratricopeptide repeat protein [Candidatus Palauibacter ramosifaciens]
MLWHSWYATSMSKKNKMQKIKSFFLWVGIVLAVVIGSTLIWPYLNYANSEYWHNRGRAFYEKKNYEKALKAFEHAISLDPEDTSAYQWKAAVFLKLESYNQAIDAYDQILAYSPDNPKIVLLKGQTYARAKQFEVALEIFDQAISTGIDRPVKIQNGTFSFQYLLLIQKSIALMELERYEEVLSVLEAAIKKSPQDANLRHSKGAALLMLERFEDAIKCFDYALQIDPDSTKAALAWNNKGCALFGLKKYDDALKAFDQALLLDADYDSAWYSRARVYVSLGNRDSAVSSLQRAIALNPDHKQNMRSDEAFQSLKGLEVFK